MPLVAGLLSLPLDDRYPLLNLSPQRQRQRTIETLLTWLLAAAVREPTLFVVEDLHWVDPSTLELLTMLVEREQAAPLLTLLTFRPEFEPPWASHENLVLIELSSLDSAETVTLATVAGGKALPLEILSEVAARTDGIPLFVEELTKMVLESGLLQEEDAGYAGRTAPAARHPGHGAGLVECAPGQAAHRQAGSRSSARRWGGSFGTTCSARSRRSDDLSLRRELDRLIAGLVYEGEPAPPPPTCSSTSSWCRMPPTSRC